MFSTREKGLHILHWAFRIGLTCLLLLDFLVLGRQIVAFVKGGPAGVQAYFAHVALIGFDFMNRSMSEANTIVWNFTVMMLALDTALVVLTVGLFWLSRSVGKKRADLRLGERQ